MQLRLMQGQYQIQVKRTPKLKRRRGKMDHPVHLECLRFDLSDPKDEDKLRVVLYHTMREAKKRELRIRTVVDVVRADDVVAVETPEQQPVLATA